MDDLILKIYSQPDTVLTLDELSLLFPKIPYSNLRRRIHYFTQAGKIRRLHHGVYAKDKYDSLELANKIYKPSYISLETVLARGGVVFQYYERIFAVSYLTREIEVGDITIQYRKIRNDVLTNIDGIEQKDRYFIASLERAFLDAVYIYKNYHFDNLGSLDWEKVFNLQHIYHNKGLIERVKSYYKDYKEDFNVK